MFAAPRAIDSHKSETSFNTHHRQGEANVYCHYIFRGFDVYETNDHCFTMLVPTFIFKTLPLALSVGVYFHPIDETSISQRNPPFPHHSYTGGDGLSFNGCFSLQPTGVHEAPRHVDCLSARGVFVLKQHWGVSLSMSGLNATRRCSGPLPLAAQDSINRLSRFL